MRTVLGPGNARRNWLSAAATICLSVSLSACATFEPADNRGATINRSATDYANSAVLLNVLRAKENEPLSFVAITGLDGTNSVTGSLGFGGFTLGPLAKRAAPTFLLGPDAVSRSGSDTFHVSVVDDPASFVALLAPVNPATIGFFINQGYPRQLLFFLLVDRVQRVRLDENRNVAEVLETLDNDPNRNVPETDEEKKDKTSPYGKFIGRMAGFLAEGLVAEVDATSVPSGRSLPPSKLCLDPFLPRPPFVFEHAIPVPRFGSKGLCENAPWIEVQAQNPAPAASAASGGGASLTLVTAQDGAVYSSVNAGLGILKVDAAGKPTLIDLSGILPPKKPTPAKQGAVGFVFDDASGDHYVLYTRSTYAAYNYIGTVIRKHDPISNLLPVDASGKGGFTNVTTDVHNCFTQVEFHNVIYCVSNEASNTKMLFSLLHQLQEINTAPSNSPTTLTVTNVP